MKFEGHYHGWMDNILVSVLPPADAAGDPRRPASVLGSEGQSPAVLEDVIALPWNDASAVEEVLEREADEIAAVLMTPVVTVQGFPALFSLSFTSLPGLHNYRDCLANDVRRYHDLVAELMNRGIRPTERGVWYLSAAHSDEDIEETLAVLEDVLR